MESGEKEKHVMLRDIIFQEAQLETIRKKKLKKPR